MLLILKVSKTYVYKTWHWWSWLHLSSPHLWSPRQLAVGGLWCPFVDGLHRTALVTEVYFGVLVVIMLLAALQKVVDEAYRAGPIQTVADLPGDVTCCWITDLGEKLRQPRVQLLILHRSGAQDGFDLRSSVGFPSKSHHTQRGGHNHRGNHDVLDVLLFCEVVVQVEGQIGAVVCQDGGMAAEGLVPAHSSQ